MQVVNANYRGWVCRVQQMISKHHEIGLSHRRYRLIELSTLPVAVGRGSPVLLIPARGIRRHKLPFRGMRLGLLARWRVPDRRAMLCISFQAVPVAVVIAVFVAAEFVPVGVMQQSCARHHRAAAVGPVVAFAMRQ